MPWEFTSMPSSDSNPTRKSGWNWDESAVTGHPQCRARLAIGEPFGSRDEATIAPLVLGCSPDLARQSDELVSLIVQSSPGFRLPPPKTEQESAQYLRNGIRTNLMLGKYHLQLCRTAAVHTEELNNQDTEDWLSLMEATARFDPEEVDRIAEQLSNHEDVRYGHVRTCQQIGCTLLRGCILDARLGSTANTNKQGLTYNPLSGLAGFSTKDSVCWDLNHSMKQKDKSDLDDLLIKARESQGPADFTILDRRALATARNALGSHWYDNHPDGSCHAELTDEVLALKDSIESSRRQ